MIKKDYFLSGIMIGAVLPVLVSVIINFVNFKLLDHTSFNIMASKPALMGSLVLNILVFRIMMINLKKHAIGKGVLLATLIYAFIILIK